MRPGAAIGAIAVFLAGAVVLGWNSFPRESTAQPDGTTSIPETIFSTTTMPVTTSTRAPAPVSTAPTTAPTTTTTTPVPEVVEAAMPAGGAAPIVWFHSLTAVSADEAWVVVAPVEASNPSNLIGRLAGGDWTMFEVSPSRWGAVGLAAAPDGEIWASTEVGIFEYDGREWGRRAEGPTAGIAVAPDGTVWAGGRRDGLGGPGDPRIWLARRDEGLWERVDSRPEAEPDGAPGARIAPDREGGVWVAVRAGLWVEDDLMHYDGTTMEIVSIPGVPDPTPDDAMPAVRVFEVDVDADGSVWAVGYLNADPKQGILARLDDAGWSVLEWPFPATTEMPEVDAAAAPDGTIWFAVGEGGLWSFDGSEWREHLGGGPAHNVDVAPDGTVWYADEAGIYVLGPA